MGGQSGMRQILLNNGILKSTISWLTAMTVICGLDAGELKLQEKFAAVAEKAMPAVVTVNSMVSRGGNLQISSTGSGFFISDDGLVVTNYHVIATGEVTAVKVADGRRVRAKIIGVSQQTDLALLKITAEEKLPYLKFADTGKVKVGHHAIAIGSPFALSQTMTTGIVSFKGRELGLNYQEEYIQTDAAINPGNSGGPLLNIDGEVIGINDCFIAPPSSGKTSGNVGLGFAIDGNLARLVILSIIKSQLPDKPKMGVVMPQYDKNSPPVISKILPDSPAEKAGLSVGDRILKIGDRKVSTIRELQLIISALYTPGDTAVITFLRSGKIKQIRLKFQ